MGVHAGSCSLCVSSANPIVGVWELATAPRILAIGSAYFFAWQRVPPLRSTSRYLSWQAEHELTTVSLTVSISSRFLVRAALCAASPAETSPSTAAFQSG